MAINAADFQIDSSGNIRRATSPATTNVYPVLDLHAWLQDLADNLAAGGDDALSILSNNPSKLDGPRDALVASRLNLINGFNIDDTAAQFINKGSVKQDTGNVMYSGLKSIGTIVAASSIYVVQGTAKLTKYWPNGHIQIMVKAKTGGTLISSGLVTVFSRQWGNKFTAFEADLSAGGENPAALSSEVDGSISLTLANALALGTGTPKVVIAVGATTLDLGNGNGTKNYDGTITLQNGCTLQEAYQYCQAICSETSAVTVNGIDGWRFRALGAYNPNDAAPMGAFSAGKWILARGWKVVGVLPAESQNYQLTASDGTTQTPPNNIGISITNLVAGDTVLVGRDTGTGINQSEYTLNGAHGSSATAIVVNEAIKGDTPTAGTIRVAGVRLPYTSYNAGTKTFTLSGTTGQAFAGNAAAFVPFIDKAATGSSESVSFIYSTSFTARVIVRNNAAVIQEYNATFSVGTGGGSSNVIRNSDQ